MAIEVLAAKLYSQKETAGRLRIGKATFLRIIREGKISFFLVGRRRMFSDEQIDRYLTRQEVR